MQHEGKVHKAYVFMYTNQVQNSKEENSFIFQMHINWNFYFSKSSLEQ
jgi:hypothetical protein